MIYFQYTKQADLRRLLLELQEILPEVQGIQSDGDNLNIEINKSGLTAEEEADLITGITKHCALTIEQKLCKKQREYAVFGRDLIEQLYVRVSINEISDEGLQSLVTVANNIRVFAGLRIGALAPVRSLLIQMPENAGLTSADITWLISELDLLLQTE